MWVSYLRGYCMFEYYWGSLWGFFAGIVSAVVCVIVVSESTIIVTLEVLKLGSGQQWYYVVWDLQNQSDKSGCVCLKNFCSTYIVEQSTTWMFQTWIFLKKKVKTHMLILQLKSNLCAIFLPCQSASKTLSMNRAVYKGVWIYIDLHSANVCQCRFL